MTGEQLGHVVELLIENGAMGCGDPAQVACISTMPRDTITGPFRFFPKLLTFHRGRPPCLPGF